MIERDISPVLRERFRQYPFVTVTGPRQSGKTTLCRNTFPELAYANLEDPTQRAFAESDPRGFIDSLGPSGLIDEVQHVPELLSYLQVIADEAARNSMYVLTGSEQFQLTESITQSLAGRTALLRLLPCSMSERRRFGASEVLNETMFTGSYPRVLDQGLHPPEAFASYVETYVERDVRRLGNVRQLTAFRQFMRLCAGRIGQLLNLTSLASDVGIRHNTARDWFTVLEASFITFQLEPYRSNIRKRLIKSPKLYFYDTGLACYLLGIEHPDQLATHPLRGALFENLVVSEVLKSHYNRGLRPNLSFFRDSNGLECDLLMQQGGEITALEVKAGATISSDYFGPIQRVAKLIPEVTRSIVVYGGDSKQTRHNVEVLPFLDLAEALESFNLQQEVDDFIRRYSSSGAERGDVDRIEEAYQRVIRPTIEAVSDVVKPIGAALFQHCSSSAIVQNMPGKSSGGTLTDPDKWQDIRDGWLTMTGSRLGEIPLTIGEEWRLSNYVGRGRRGFGLNLRLLWEFTQDEVLRVVNIDEQPLPSPNTSTRYSDLQAMPPSSDRLIADLTKELMRRIADLSAE